ncbi:MAG: MYG1 family protein [Candidatus Campbellbacteria bacterium]|nr:MYG1 family protein [Candidatus Campbellbacteria bacterium]
MKTLITHGSKFHPDEVFGTAAIRIVEGGDINIIRTRDPKLFDQADYLLDVGGVYDPEKNRFDHHQEGGAGKRQSGIPYATFGLVWLKFGEIIAGSKKNAEAIDRKMVSFVDSRDCGVSVAIPKRDDVSIYTIDEVIDSFNLNIDEEGKNVDDMFLKAVDLAEVLINREVLRQKTREKTEPTVREAFENREHKNIVLFHCRCPYKEILREYKDVLYAVFGDSEGHWVVVAARDFDSNDMYAVKKPFPKEWRGKRGKELEQVTGVEGSIFCHNNGFLSVAKTCDGALALAKISLE